jgi:hypothetical protein
MNEFVNVAMYLGANAKAHLRFEELYNKYFKGEVVLPENQCADLITAYVPESFLPRFIAILDTQENLAKTVNIYKDGQRIRTHERVPCSLLELTLENSSKPKKQFETELGFFAPGSILLESDKKKAYLRIPKGKADDYSFMLQHSIPEVSLATKVA